MPEVITDNIDLWCSALRTKSTAGRGSNGKVEAYGIKKLRELILELAVRGKLLPQDPNDEPAQTLLERIAKEKAHLLKEGQIKKGKALPVIGDDEKQFELPKGWQWRRMQDISSYIQRGKGPQYADTGKVKVVSQKCVQWAGFDLAPARHVDDTSLEKYQPERFLKNGDLLWNSTGTGTVGRTNVVHDIDANSLVADSHVTIIRPLLTDSNFLWCYLSAPGIQSRIEPEHEKALVSGTTNQVELNTSAVVQLVVPIPPLAEQHRIVAKVEELMALCDQLEQQQTNNIEAHLTLVETLLSTLTNVESQEEFTEAWNRIADHFDTLFTTEQSIDQLKQTILQLAVMGKLVPQDPNDEPAKVLLARAKAAKEQLSIERRLRQSEVVEFSEPELLFDLPDGWTWAHVTDVALIQGGKRLPPGAELVDTPTPHIYIRVTDMKDGSILESGLRYLLPEVQREISRYIVNKEDLYITIAGTIGSIGTIPDWLDGQNLTENAAKIVFRHLDKHFFLLALTSEFVQSQFIEKTKQMAQPKLALKRIAGAMFCLPPIAEQHRIVAKVDELMALCDTLKERLADAKTTQIHLADEIVEQAVA